MLLTADIGNTSITLGLFDDCALVEEFRLASDKDLSLEEYEVLLKSLFRQYNVDGCIISSVVEELSQKFKTAVDEVLKIDSILLNSSMNTGIKILLPNKNEIGADRIANAAGAYVLYKHPVIVVDFGTATSFDIVNKYFVKAKSYIFNNQYVKINEKTVCGVDVTLRGYDTPHEKIPVQGIVWNANGYYYAIYSDKYLDMKEVEELIGRIVSTKEYQVGN